VGYGRYRQSPSPIVTLTPTPTHPNFLHNWSFFQIGYVFNSLRLACAIQVYEIQSVTQCLQRYIFRHLLYLNIVTIVILLFLPSLELWSTTFSVVINFS